MPQHSSRVFVERVDCVSGVGYDRAALDGPSATRFHEIRVVVSNKAVLDFATPDHSMRIRSLRPGVTVDDILENTGSRSIPDDVPTTRLPTTEDLQIIREVLDPTNLRNAECCMTHPTLHTAVCELFGV